MSTHGPQHDEFPAQATSQHGGATYDDGFGRFPAAHSEAHGKLFDKFSTRPGVDRYGERWDEFGYKDVPSLHGTHYDEGFDAPSFDGDGHGQLHDVFRGSRVRYMYGGRDVEGIVLDTQRDFAVVESREGDRHEVTLPQMLQYATEQGNPHNNEMREAKPASVDTSVVASKPSAPANGGERVEGGSYDDSVFSNKSLSDALEVVKALAPFDEEAFDKDAQEFADVAKTDGGPGVAHLSTAKLTEAHSKFSDHYTAARVTGNHERAHFAAHVLASIHHELATRGVMAEKPDDGAHPTTRGVLPGQARMKTATDDADVSKGAGQSPIPRLANGHPAFGKATPEQMCGHFKWLDKEYGTTKDSPLHHDNRCPIHSSRSSVGKAMDADEGATQREDVEGDNTSGANWCKTCQHYCRKVENGHCPTCGGPVGVKKNWMDSLDVLKGDAAPAKRGPAIARRYDNSSTVHCPDCASKAPPRMGPSRPIYSLPHPRSCDNCGKDLK